jgi:hypothetical protein
MEIFFLSPRAVLEPHFPQMLVALDFCPKACKLALASIDGNPPQRLSVTGAVVLVWK